MARVIANVGPAFGLAYSVIWDGTCSQQPSIRLYDISPKLDNVGPTLVFLTLLFGMA